LDLRYLILFVLAIMSAFFSASETAFSTVNIIRLKNAKDEGRRGARVALYIADNFDKTLSAILIGNNIVNIAASSLATLVAIDALDGIRDNLGQLYGPVVATAVTTIVILIFGEITPKSYAKENALELSLKVSYILLFFMRLFAPLVFVLVRINRMFGKLFKKQDAQPSVTEDELEVIIDTMEEEGVIHEDEREMMRNVLELSETNVYDIMTPRVDMVGIYLDDDLDYIMDLFFNEKYSRIPVYNDSKDNIIGILYERDFFSALIKADDRKSVLIEKIMKEPLFVPKSMHVDALMALLQRNKQHLAIVSDEYGGTSGLVTMEDCLEELVGEIYDEHDEEEFDIKKIDDDNYEISASIELDDLFEDLELGREPETQYNNVGGWLYQQLEEIPKVGDEYVYHSMVKIENDVTTIDDDEYIELKLTFTVKELSDRRMKTIHLNIERRELGLKTKKEDVKINIEPTEEILPTTEVVEESPTVEDKP
jgi:putative hemolysin